MSNKTKLSRRPGRLKKRGMTHLVEEAAQHLHSIGLLTIPEAAAKSGISLHKLHWQVRQRHIPFERFGLIYGLKLRDVLKLRTFEHIHQRGLLTLSEAAAKSGISEARLYWLAARHRLRYVRFGRYYAFKLNDVLAARPNKPPDGYCTIYEAAKRLGIQRETLRLHVLQSLIPSIAYRGLQVVKLEDVQAYLSSPPGYIRVSEAARRRGLRASTLHAYINRGRLPSIEHHGMRMVKLADLNAAWGQQGRPTAS